MRTAVVWRATAGLCQFRVTVGGGAKAESGQRQASPADSTVHNINLCMCTVPRLFGFELTRKLLQVVCTRAKWSSAV